LDTFNDYDNDFSKQCYQADVTHMAQVEESMEQIYDSPTRAEVAKYRELSALDATPVYRQSNTRLIV
jgi:hypothetical protein